MNPKQRNVLQSTHKKYILKLKSLYLRNVSSLWHGKTIQVAMGGAKPWFYVENGELKGSDVMLVRLLSKKLGFKYEMKAVGWHDLVVEMVS